MKKALIIEFKEKGDFGKIESYYVGPSAKIIKTMFKSDDKGNINGNTINETYVEIINNGYQVNYITVENFPFEDYDFFNAIMKLILKNYDIFMKETREVIDFRKDTRLVKEVK